MDLDEYLVALEEVAAARDRGEITDEQARKAAAFLAEQAGTSKGEKR